MEIILEKVKESRKETLFRLLQYSLFEESLSDQNDMDEEAVFAYPWFDAYFKEKERAAFFIKEDGTDRLLGFVMINNYVRKSRSGRSIAEFMVLPKFRRKKIGKTAAFMCFNMYRGSWEVSPACGSRPAYLFWKSVIDEYTGENSRYEDGIFLFSNVNMEKPEQIS